MLARCMSRQCVGLMLRFCIDVGGPVLFVLPGSQHRGKKGAALVGLVLRSLQQACHHQMMPSLGEQCTLTKVLPTERDGQQYNRHCCAETSQPAWTETCMLVPEQQDITIYGDSHFYSSYMLVLCSGTDVQARPQS